MNKNSNPLALLMAMQHRMESKRPVQWDLKDVLPDEDVDFQPYFSNSIPKELDHKPEGTRRDIAVQKELLRWHRRGKPEITALHMLLISYLRRESNYTQKARNLFFRLWDEHGNELLEILPLREQISAMRTFADHGQNLQRRLSAKMGFIYISLIKIYESERLADGLSADTSTFLLPIKSQDLHIEQVRAVNFGRDDSVEIIHLMLAEEVLKDDLIGAMLLNIMTAVQAGDTLFSRVDKTRLKSKFDTRSSTFWSFGFNPAKISLDEFMEDELV